ncbi:glutaredoxin family protein [Candidatus Methanoperedens nitratireducens]|nr:glutaredoxin family protein [Candidatus Methanoperedens nitroreducens]
MKVFMYTLSIDPWSRKTKKFFRDKNIQFEYMDYDLVGEKEQEKILEDMYKCGGSTVTAFPFVKIDEDVVVGYNPEAYSKLLRLDIQK